MKKVYIKISCIIEGRLGINNHFYYFLKKEKRIKLKVCFDKAFFLEFTPINNASYLPCLCKIEWHDGTIISNAPFLHIFDYGKNTFEILITPFRSNAVQSCDSKNNYCEANNKTKHASFKNNILEYQDKNKIKIFEIQEQLYEPKIEINENTIFLYGKDKDNLVLHLFSIDKEKQVKQYCTQYEIKDNLIRCLENLNTYAHHKKITCYDKNTLELVETFVAYERKPRQIKNTKLIPYAFMQNIYAKDYKLAQTFLDETAYDLPINKQAFSGFFGDFCMIATPQIEVPKNTVCLIYKKNTNTYFSRYFVFEFNQYNKITNIYEYKLI